MTAMCGDDAVARNGGGSDNGTDGTRSDCIRIRANGRCRGVYGATGSLSWACTKTMCRPALALSRSQLGVSVSGWPTARVKSVPAASPCIGAWGGPCVADVG